MSETIERVINQKQLLALIADAYQKKERIQSIAGELGERVKHAVENGHLHKGAFALMVRLHRMETTRRDDFIRSIQNYLYMCEFLWGDQHHGDLVDEAEKAEDQQTAADLQMKLNGERIEAGIKQIDAEADDGKKKRGRPKATSKKASAEAFQDDAQSDRPSVQQNEKRETLPGGDAPGSYRMQ